MGYEGRMGVGLEGVRKGRGRALGIAVCVRSGGTKVVLVGKGAGGTCKGRLAVLMGLHLTGTVDAGQRIKMPRKKSRRRPYSNTVHQKRALTCTQPLLYRAPVLGIFGQEASLRIVRLAEILDDGTTFLQHQIAVLDSRALAQGARDLGAEFGRRQAVGGALGMDELVGKLKGFEHPGDANGARGIEEPQRDLGFGCHFWM